MNLSFFVAWFSSFLRPTRLSLNFLRIISVCAFLQRHFLFKTLYKFKVIKYNIYRRTKTFAISIKGEKIYLCKFLNGFRRNKGQTPVFFKGNVRLYGKI